MYSYMIGQKDKYGAGVDEIVDVVPVKFGIGDITLDEKVSAYPHKLVCDAGVIRLKSDEEEAQDEQARYSKKRIMEIVAELADIDRRSIRPARNRETDRLADLEKQAIVLRDELAQL